MKKNLPITIALNVKTWKNIPFCIVSFAVIVSFHNWDYESPPPSASIYTLGVLSVSQSYGWVLVKFCWRFLACFCCFLDINIAITGFAKWKGVFKAFADSEGPQSDQDLCHLLTKSRLLKNE